jgi:putative endonuclease
MKWWPGLGTEKKRLGRRGEKAAARFLKRRGLQILARNLHLGRGEIDIVALDGSTLVFVEVKSRTERSWCEDLEKVDRRKRVSLRKACLRYLAAIQWRAEAYRVDGVCVELRKKRWFYRVADIRWYESILDLEAWG